MRSYFMKGKKQKFGSTLSTVINVYIADYSTIFNDKISEWHTELPPCDFILRSYKYNFISGIDA